ncbi:MAG: hypothetical protein M1818_001442 [Claussenomyces sp. TS43310]|nr:MAG: hypothetical protein M1818_001442 [Claussenomyces sp. TS43310]
MQAIAPSLANAMPTAELDRTIESLRSRLDEQEALLAKMRASSESTATTPPADHALQLRQLSALKVAYESLTPAELDVPLPDSPLAALLALRSSYTLLWETRFSSSGTRISLINAGQLLEKEQADLNDAKSVNNNLKIRISALHELIQQRTQTSSSDIVRDTIRSMKKKRLHYDSETEKLVRAFNLFVDHQLAVMLATEEMGGPVIGDMLDMDELALEAGFNNQGKARTHKDITKDDKRQQRIDDIWGGREMGRSRDEAFDEKRAAAAEMRELTEELLNQAVQASETGSDGYIELTRESAAVRFLVRSKVAQFHPKDARRLRLVDFGRALDD